MRTEATQTSEVTGTTAVRSTPVAIAGAWLLIACVSDLPNIILHHLAVAAPPWLLWIKVAILALAVPLVCAFKALRSLWKLTTIMLVFLLGFASTSWVGKQPWWDSFLPGAERSFFLGYLKLYMLDSALALIVIVALRALQGSFAASYLVGGDLRAPLAPVGWLGIRKTESWGVFGWIFGLVAFLVVLIPTLLAMHPTRAQMASVVPLLPAILLFTAVNAFNEETYFRASMLATLPAAVGKANAMLISAAFFGLAHYLYGSPSGLIGAGMTGFLAWIMAKAMLETRGLGWPWIIHMFPDAAVFFSYALAWGAR